MKIKLLIFGFWLFSLTSCDLNPFNQVVKTGGDVITEYKKADTLQNLSEIPQDIADAVADTKLEVKELENQLANEKLKQIVEQLNRFKSPDDVKELLEKIIPSNEKISIETQKTLQIRAENNPFVFGSLGVIVGILFSILCYVLLAFGKRISGK